LYQATDDECNEDSNERPPHIQFALRNTSRRCQYNQIGRDRNRNTDCFDEQKDEDDSQAVLYQEEIQAIHVDASIRSLNEFNFV